MREYRNITFNILATKQVAGLQQNLIYKNKTTKSNVSSHLSATNIGGVAGGEGGRGQGQKVGRAPPHTFWFPKNPLKDEFDNTFDIGDFRAHIFCPQRTQELAEKHHEAGPPEQLPTDTLLQIDYGHTRHCEDCKEVCLCQRTTQN